MIKKEVINGAVFIAQTAYYIYRNKEELQNNSPFLMTSEKKTFERYKELIKNGEVKLRKK